MGQAAAQVVHASIPLTESAPKNSLGGNEGASMVNRTWYRLFNKLQTLITAIATQIVTADQSITTTTALTNITGLSFNIGSEQWLATFTLDVGAALNTTGIKVAVTTPTGATQNITASVCGFTGRTTTSGAGISFSAASLAAFTDGVMTVSVWVQAAAGNSGAVQIQFAQATSSATALTVREGSQMIANRIQ